MIAASNSSGPIASSNGAGSIIFGAVGMWPKRTIAAIGEVIAIEWQGSGTAAGWRYGMMCAITMMISSLTVGGQVAAGGREPSSAFGDPWWWWGASSWNTMTAFLALGRSQPVTYDYGVNVVDQGDTVYFNGQPEASATQYEQQAVQLANPQNPTPPPAPNQGWTPLGVWASEKGNRRLGYWCDFQRPRCPTHPQRSL
jgi:hypothetical protein